jgi:hypothetical protein
LASPDVGGGMSLLAPLKLAVVESLRPTFTSQLGPPSCPHVHPLITGGSLVQLKWNVLSLSSSL